MNIAAPQISPLLASVAGLRKHIENDETLMGAVVCNEDVGGIVAKGFNANEVKLIKIATSGAQLEKTSFSDVAFVSCELTATVLAESSWRRVSLTGSRCSGLQLQTSVLKDIAFTDCKLDLANFRFAKLKNVCFKDCALEEADFYAAQLEHVTFVNCTMDKVSFADSKLKHVDLRTSDIIGITGIHNLAGATIDSIQLVALAPLLAHELNITVKDE